MSMTADILNRYRDIRWPADFRPQGADLLVFNEIDIRAPVQRAWKYIVEATEWPNWYPGARNVSVRNPSGVLQENAVMLWTTFGRTLTSSVTEFSPYSRISWISSTPGYTPEWYHTWSLISIGDGCRVVLGEVGKGPNAMALRHAVEHGMHRGHELWLRALKERAETSAATQT